MKTGIVWPIILIFCSFILLAQNLSLTPADFLPRKYNPELYDSIWQRDPFASNGEEIREKEIEEHPDLLTLKGVSRIKNKYFVSLEAPNLHYSPVYSEYFFIIEGEKHAFRPDETLEIASVKLHRDYKQTQVTIKRVWTKTGREDMIVLKYPE